MGNALHKLRGFSAVYAYHSQHMSGSYIAPQLNCIYPKQAPRVAFSPATGGVKEAEDDGAVGGKSPPALPSLFPSDPLDCVATRYSSSKHLLRRSARVVCPADGM